MVVAAGAGDGEAKKGLAEGVDLVIDDVGADLAEADAIVVAEFAEAEGGGADFGFVEVGGGVEAGGGKLVAGEVLADELGVGDVGVEGADEVVAVVVGAVDFVVPIIAESFGETHEVHPVAGPLLAEVGGAEVAVDLALVGSRGLIVFKKIDLERGGREAGENEAEATEEGGTVGLAF